MKTLTISWALLLSSGSILFVFFIHSFDFIRLDNDKLERGRGKENIPDSAQGSYAEPKPATTLGLDVFGLAWLILGRGVFPEPAKRRQ